MALDPYTNKKYYLIDKMINFYKYHGTGNDFIIIDSYDADTRLQLHRDQIQSMCSRRFGIGADGLMIIQTDPHDRFDFQMIYYNSDGHKSSMCGNGGRCITSHAFRKGYIGDNTTFSFEGREYFAIVRNENFVSLKMENVDFVDVRQSAYVLDTGSPHYVQFVDGLESMDIFQDARNIRYNSEFREKGINVNFCEMNTESLMVATYERGVENETFSCGTGVVASVLCSLIRYNKPNGHHTQNVETKGGMLEVSCLKIDNTFEDIFLSGPAQFVFEGSILH